MLAGDSALGVSEPQPGRQLPDCLAEAADRVGLPGARSAKKILGGLAVMLHPLDRGQAVMGFAWCFGHDGRLRSPASAFRAGEGVRQSGRHPPVTRWEHPFPRTGGDLARHHQPIAARLSTQRGEAAFPVSGPQVRPLGDGSPSCSAAPGYYRRFGFELSTVYQITPPKPEWQPHFQVRVLSGYQPRLRGMFTYAEPFDRT